MKAANDNEDDRFYNYLQQMVERGYMSEEAAEYAWKRHLEAKEKNDS